MLTLVSVKGSEPLTTSESQVFGRELVNSLGIRRLRKEGRVAKKVDIELRNRIVDNFPFLEQRQGSRD